jgi:acetyl-CoA C-acetyltransferase
MNDVVVIGGIEKMTDVVGSEATNILAMGLDQEWEAFFGVTFPGIYAMIATKHMHDFGTTREQLAQVAVKNHANGVLNPYAQFKREMKIENIINAPMVAYPLGMLDCSPVSDGAAALILCAADKAKKLTDKSVKIIGSGQASDTLALHGRNDICTFESTTYAARMAYKQANVEPNDISVAEVHDCFTIAEILAIEDLGFVKKGDGGKAIDNKITTLDGKIPVNPSGGLKAKGHPVGATGVAQIAEIVLQLRGEADKRQVKDAKIGLTHNVGAGGASCVVNILEAI